MGLHEIILRVRRERKEEIQGLSSGHLQSLQVGKEMEREWLLKQKKPREEVLSSKGRNRFRRRAINFANCCWLR